MPPSSRRWPRRPTTARRTCTRRAPTRNTSRSSGPRSTSGTSCTTGRMRSSPPTPTPRPRGSSRSWSSTRPGPRTPRGRRAAAYGALLAHFSALKVGEVDKITAFEVADARQALKLDGAKFIAKYPRNPNALTVKFNIARAYYDDGDFERAPALHRLCHGVPGAEGRAGGGQARAGQPPSAQRLQGHRGHHPQVPLQLAAAARLPGRGPQVPEREQGRGAGRAGPAELGGDRRRGGGPAQGRLGEQGRRHRREGALRRLHRGAGEAGLRQGAGDRRQAAHRLPEDRLHLGRAGHAGAPRRRVRQVPRGRPVVRAAGRPHGRGRHRLRGLDGGGPDPAWCSTTCRARQKDFQSAANVGGDRTGRGAGAARPDQAQGARHGRGQGRGRRRRWGWTRPTRTPRRCWPRWRQRRASGPRCWPRRSPRW